MSQNSSRLQPPHAAKHPVNNTRHGITRTDDYAWLRADNWQEVFRTPPFSRPKSAHISKRKIPIRQR